MLKRVKFKMRTRSAEDAQGPYNEEEKVTIVNVNMENVEIDLNVHGVTSSRINIWGRPWEASK